MIPITPNKTGYFAGNFDDSPKPILPSKSIKGAINFKVKHSANGTTTSKPVVMTDFVPDVQKRVSTKPIKRTTKTWMH